jgi:hypothetical protein
MNHEAELALDAVLAECRGEKDGEFVLDRLISFYTQQSAENQTRLNMVLCGWIDSGDPIKADHSIALAGRLKITSMLPKLLSSLQQIRDGESNLPRYFEQFLVPAINRLQS